MLSSVPSTLMKRMGASRYPAREGLREHYDKPTEDSHTLENSEKRATRVCASLVHGSLGQCLLLEVHDFTCESRAVNA